ncbi:hypothetical protein [Tuwongella immobilis]|uniref:Uncharacterized protein n=1 Tax=Tuwongella immobilis TaxID=692036 RepID=A0A6C2YTF6_9BACT|nr:hypothetical protein [Tuwongella immobilis]VIP04403.1 unnamed protein product [Tuwongella immobilis]VTS06168.1 unnamed protein product [Tuwongella immobilis]
MQSARERVLAFLLLMAIFLIGGGFIGYQFLYKPVADRELTLAALQSEIDTANGKARGIERDLPRLAKMQQRSLPADIDMARREYEGQLSRMLREAQFSPTSIMIDPRPPETAGVPTIATRKPAYTRLNFVVQARGELINLVDFLAAFYELDLLHAVKKITVQKLATSRGADSRLNEVEVNLTVEALVMDTAEKRKTLMPAEKTGMSVLATPKRDYGAIAGKDVFFGSPPPPPQVTQQTETKIPEFDLSPYVRLTSVTRSEMWTPEEQTALSLVGGGLAITAPDPGRVTATIFDFLHRHEFEIEAMPDGPPRSQGYYYIGDRKRKMIGSPYLSLGEESDGSRKFYRIIRFEGEDLLLQQIDPRGLGVRQLGTLLGGGGYLPAFPEPVMRWHVGDLLQDASTLSNREARSWVRPAPVSTRSRGL